MTNGTEAGRRPNDGAGSGGPSAPMAGFVVARPPTTASPPTAGPRSSASPASTDSPPPTAAPADLEAVSRLLGRPPAGSFVVVVRTADGAPAVIENAPFLADGTPMPTRYWLVDPVLREAVSRLESAGGVRRAEAEVPPDRVADAHARYATERDASIGPGHRGPVPTGGVGGTRHGVKCLHAHLAWWLTGADDPVGEWTSQHIGIGPSEGATDL